MGSNCMEAGKQVELRREEEGDDGEVKKRASLLHLEKEREGMALIPC